MNRVKSGLCVMLILSFAIFAGYGEHKEQETQSKPLIVLEDSSFFSSFAIDKDTKTVVFTCYLTFENQDDREHQFKVLADFQLEQKNGLLDKAETALLTGRQIGSGNTVFCVQPHDNLSCYVEFAGRWGGNLQKTNRDLPAIVFSSIE